MKVEQVYNIVNTAITETTGKSDLVQEDLSNLVDVGNEVFNANAVDNYVKRLVNKVGKTIFVDRPYSGNVPSLLMDSWEYGSVLEKIRAVLPAATENPDWSLTDGQDYSDGVFHAPQITAKFFNSKITFEVPMSFTERQLKESFRSASDMNAFLSMLYNTVDKSITVKIDALIMRTINSMIADTLYSDLASDGALNLGDTGVKAVNLLKLYNEKYTEKLTAANCMENPAFIRFASYIISKYRDRVTSLSTLFNIGGVETFTPVSDLHIVMLSDFVRASDVFLQSDVYHNELVKFPTVDTIPYWQGTGTDYAFNSVSKIHVKTQTAEVDASGILAVMFDKNAMGVCNTDRRVTTSYVASADFYTNYYKADMSFFTDCNENCIVFFVGEADTEDEEPDTDNNDEPVVQSVTKSKKSA